jgi:hypothetical protein
MIPRPVVASVGSAVRSAPAALAIAHSLVAPTPPPSLVSYGNQSRSVGPALIALTPLAQSSGTTTRGGFGGGSAPTPPSVPLPPLTNPVSGGYLPSTAPSSSAPSAVPFTPPANPNATPDASLPDASTAPSAPSSTTEAPDAPVATGAQPVTQTARSGVPVLAIAIGVGLITIGAGVVLWRKKKR